MKYNIIHDKIKMFESSVILVKNIAKNHLYISDFYTSI